MFDFHSELAARRKRFIGFATGYYVDLNLKSDMGEATDEIEGYYNSIFEPLWRLGANPNVNY